MDAVIERFRTAIRNPKQRVLRGQISGIQYQSVLLMMRAEAIREGLKLCDVEGIIDEVEHSVNYARPRIYVAPID